MVVEGQTQVLGVFLEGDKGVVDVEGVFVPRGQSALGVVEGSGLAFERVEGEFNRIEVVRDQVEGVLDNVLSEVFVVGVDPEYRVIRIKLEVYFVMV